MDWKKVSNAAHYYRTACKKLKNATQNMTRSIHPRELAGGLLCMREEALLHALSFSQGDIVEAILAQEHLRNEPDLSASDLKKTEKTTELCNLLVFRYSFEYCRKRLESGDLEIYSTSDGLEEIRNLAENPVSHVKEVTQNMERMMKSKEEERSCPTQRALQLWSKKMIGPIRWSLLNQVPLEVCGVTHRKEVERVLDHMGQLGESMSNSKHIHLDKRVCYDLSYDLHSSLSSVCRVVYLESAAIRNTMNSAGSHRPLSLIYESDLGIEDWDVVVYEAYMRDVNREYLCDLEVPTIPHWQMAIKGGSLWASIVFFAFMERNREIILDRLDKGRIFEEHLRNELVDRDVRVIKRNLLTPFGEVDFVCEKQSKSFVIEAKDYGPWYENWYLASKKFHERTQTLERRLKDFPKKVEWVNSNLKEVGIDKLAVGLFISRHVERPVQGGITVSELDKYFGPSKYLDRRSSLPILEGWNDEEGPPPVVRSL